MSKAAVDDLAAVPPQNAEIYGRLFEIENALRELIVESMSAVAGPRWYHHRLPHESRVNVEQGLARDHQTRWTQNVIHHPMYYVDFSDLRLTIEQRDNWSDAFRQVFSKNKELVTTDLSELEFIRNKVAHNRRASTVDVDVVRAAHAKLTSVLGNRLEALSQRYSIVSSAATYLGQLKREGEVAYTLCSRGRRIKNLGTWELAASTWWWFDDWCLGHPTGRIARYFESLTTYRRLMSEGKLTEGNRWAAGSTLKEQYGDAVKDLTAGIQDWSSR